MIQKTLKYTSKLHIQEKTVSGERRKNAEGEKDGKNLAFKHIKVGNKRIQIHQGWAKQNRPQNFISVDANKQRDIE